MLKARSESALLLGRTRRDWTSLEITSNLGFNVQISVVVFIYRIIPIKRPGRLEN
jgi:hypothetical protein